MPKVVDIDQKRSEFVDATWRIIRNEGFSAATLRRVAAEASCTTGALTHYFSTREALLVEALRSAHSAATARMIEKARTIKGDRKRLEAILLEALPLDTERMEEWKTRLGFWSAASDSEVLRRENARRFADWSEFLQRCLTPFVRHPEALKREVLLLTSLVDGLALRLVVQCRSQVQIQATVPEIVYIVKFHLGALYRRYA